MNCDNKNEKQWVPVSSSLEPSSYPIAIAKNQYQEMLPVFPYRFQDAESMFHDLAARDQPPEEPRIEPYDLPPTLMGAQPYKPAVTTVTVRKRGRPRKYDGGDEDSTCVVCNDPEVDTAQVLEGISPFFKLTCHRCKFCCFNYQR